MFSLSSSTKGPFPKGIALLSTQAARFKQALKVERTRRSAGPDTLGAYAQAHWVAQGVGCNDSWSGGMRFPQRSWRMEGQRGTRRRRQVGLRRAACSVQAILGAVEGRLRLAVGGVIGSESARYVTLSRLAGDQVGPKTGCHGPCAEKYPGTYEHHSRLLCVAEQPSLHQSQKCVCSLDYSERQIS